jgi:hypothetical protein
VVLFALLWGHHSERAPNPPDFPPPGRAQQETSEYMVLGSLKEGLRG